MCAAVRQLPTCLVAQLRQYTPEPGRSIEQLCGGVLCDKQFVRDKCADIR